jgi:hypothetical protein
LIHCGVARPANCKSRAFSAILAPCAPTLLRRRSAASSASYDSLLRSDAFVPESSLSGSLSATAPVTGTAASIIAFSRLVFFELAASTFSDRMRATSRSFSCRRRIAADQQTTAFSVTQREMHQTARGSNSPGSTDLGRCSLALAAPTSSLFSSSSARHFPSCSRRCVCLRRRYTSYIDSRLK